MALRKSLFKPPHENNTMDRVFDACHDEDGELQGDLTPLSWEDYFDEKIDCDVDANTRICAYVTGREAEGPVFILHHGAGHSALSFGVMTRRLSGMFGDKGCTVVAFDCRGHGDTKTGDDYDLSIQRLSEDVVGVYRSLFDESAR
ncbi:Protein phosphatase methylesterase 1, partial [Spiromyces aspiralis]